VRVACTLFPLRGASLRDGHETVRRALRFFLS
jgi:hypothetical protein